MKEQNTVIENLEEEILELSDNTEAKMEEVVEELEEKVEEVQENIDEGVETLTSEAEELEEVVEPIAAPLKKHDQAKELVEKAKVIVKEAEEQLEECKLLLASDLKEYENAKNQLKEKGMHACETLLGELDYVSEEKEEDTDDEDVVVFEPKEEVEPIYIHDVSSGRFTGFLMALIGGVATFAGMAYFATKQLGVTLDIAKVPTLDSVKPIFSYYGTLLGMPDNMSMGASLVALVVLLVMWIIYAIRVSIKGGANLHHATEQLAHAEEYTVQKSNCKDEMDKVDAYIHDSIKTLKTYQIIFNEQKGKLERIIHLESNQEEGEEAEYHHKSMLEMKDTRELIDAVKDFMAIPMSEEGKLSGKSSLFLHRAKSRIQKTIDRLY